MVTHRDVSSADMDNTLSAMSAILN
jgi:hypothetical protein